MARKSAWATASCTSGLTGSCTVDGPAVAGYVCQAGAEATGAGSQDADQAGSLADVAADANGADGAAPELRRMSSTRCRQASAASVKGVGGPG